MTNHELRRDAREELFLMADLRVEGQPGEHRVRIRNLSEGGFMAEGLVKASPGASIEADLGNAGWVAGSVAWVQDNRFGVAFRGEVDLQQVCPGSSRTPLSPSA